MNLNSSKSCICMPINIVSLWVSVCLDLERNRLAIIASYAASSWSPDWTINCLSPPSTLLYNQGAWPQARCKTRTNWYACCSKGCITTYRAKRSRERERERGGREKEWRELARRYKHVLLRLTGSSLFSYIRKPILSVCKFDILSVSKSLLNICKEPKVQHRKVFGYFSFRWIIERVRIHEFLPILLYQLGRHSSKGSRVVPCRLPARFLITGESYSPLLKIGKCVVRDAIFS